MSKILLYQSPGTQLPQLETALAKKDHQVHVLSSLDDLDPPLTSADVTVIDATGGSGADGTACCRSLTAAHPEMSLILLLDHDTQLDGECRQLTGGNVLRMPFTARKVVNRIKKLADCVGGRTLSVGNLTLNLDKRCVRRDDHIYRLTPRQARLLQVFMENEGRTLTRKFLMENVWETDYMGDTRTLDVHVRWLRERIEEDPGAPRYLRTVRGIGYRMGFPPD